MIGSHTQFNLLSFLLLKFPIQPSPLYKIIIVGSSGVGKTAMIHPLVDDTFPTVGVEFRSFECQTGSDTVRLNLCDTSGQEKFRSVSKAHFHSLIAFLLILLQVRCPPTVFIIVVGNKSDLTAERVIGIEKAQVFGERHGIDDFETFSTERKKRERNVRSDGGGNSRGRKEKRK
jgi:GTPase SAR1 family protein